MNMKYLKFKSQYDKFPKTKIYGYKAFEGYESIVEELKSKFSKKKIVCFEFYPGINMGEVKENLIDKLGFDNVINFEDYAKKIEDIDEMIKRNLTDNRVFGVMSHFVIDDFYHMEQVKELSFLILGLQGRVLVYGFGSSLIDNFDDLVYFDLSRWEIQLRFRQGMPNWHCANYEEDKLRKFKRGFFVEWRTADRLKKKIINRANYIIDTNVAQDPKMITIDAFFAGLHKVSTQPFRLVPYFDPGVWGGQWMKEVCNLDKSQKNYAWSFDGVPEENCIHLDYEGIIVEVPAIDVVFFEPENLLGKKVYGRFGTEYPIRFDFLDTMEGQNLSLQVHPLTEYIQDKFGMNYTQDESYYILDAKPDASVYLGVKKGIKPSDLIGDLEAAQAGKIQFDANKYINNFPAKKHDHFLIPAGTIHCSGKNAMVLEISATPYIFTFKLYDWDRVGLDGLPRPINIQFGKDVIQYDRDTDWVKDNLINHFEPMEDGSTKTGLHEKEFIETRRYFFKERIKISTCDSFNQNNLIEGEGAIIESVNGEFEPFTLHYAETFIIPEHVKEYYIKPLKNKQLCGIIKAYVR